jgi:hypothetical protein
MTETSASNAGWEIRGGYLDGERCWEILTRNAGVVSPQGGGVAVVAKVTATHDIARLVAAAPTLLQMARLLAVELANLSRVNRDGTVVAQDLRELAEDLAEIVSLVEGTRKKGENV